MCGRYVIAFDPEALVAGFSVLRVVPFPKRWNVAPQSPVPVVHETRDGERVAETMRWGLVPHWAKDPAVGAKLCNARADGILDKPSFRQAVRRRRCLLPASGFYEWQATPAGKQPWYFSAADGAPTIAMAGVFEAWRPDDASPWLLSCCIVTTDANATMAPVHDRMPVVLPASAWDTWLARDLQDPRDIAPLLAPPTAGLLRAWPVSKAVNRAAHDGEALLEPVAL